MKMMKKVFDLFDHFGIDFCENNGMIICPCPIHEGDNETAFNINIDEDNDFYGKWFCNTKKCHNDKGGNDILSLIKRLLDKQSRRDTPFGEVVSFCESFTNGVAVNCSSFALDSDPLKKLFLPKKEVVVDNRISRKMVRERLRFPAYFYLDRGFTKEALDLFDVGVCDTLGKQMCNRVVFPVYDETDSYVVGSTGRTLVDHPVKWLNQKGFNKSNYLYGYGKSAKPIRDKDSIILVEGQGDVIRMYEAGVKNVVGMFGSSLSDAQEFLIQKTGVSTVILITDNDEAGKKCSIETIEKLKYLFNIKVVSYPKKDVGEMTVQEIRDIIVPQL